MVAVEEVAQADNQGIGMARIRTIKPEFWTDSALMECSLNARLLFIGTWNFADDNGNLDRSAKQIKARVFPADIIDCEPLLLELIAQRLICEYVVDDKKYLHIQGFRKHQIINRPSKPQCPLDDESRRTHGALTEHSSPEGKGREGKDTTSTFSTRTSAAQSVDKSTPGFINSNSTPRASAHSTAKARAAIEEGKQALANRADPPPALMRQYARKAQA